MYILNVAVLIEDIIWKIPIRLKAVTAVMCDFAGAIVSSVVWYLLSIHILSPRDLTNTQ